MTWILGAPWKSSSGKDGKVSSSNQRMMVIISTSSEGSQTWVFQNRRDISVLAFFRVFFLDAAPINKVPEM